MHIGIEATIGPTVLKYPIRACALIAIIEGFYWLRKSYYLYRTVPTVK